MKVKAKLNNLRVSPRKVRLVADLIRGMDVDEAIYQLDARVKRANVPLQKLIESAVSNGENDFGVSRGNMYIESVIVGAGPTLKRWMPRAFGRATMIRKRTSKIELVLEERIEGKDRKSKEQIEAEKKKRHEEKIRAEKAKEKENEDKGLEKKEKSKAAVPASAESEKSISKEKAGWTNKIFRRKSM